MATAIKVFICYASEDQEVAQRLYDDLKRAGVTPWMACEDILPGQDWEHEIDQAIRESSYFLALLSSHSISRRGFVQKELKKALAVLDELPPSQIFLIPARLDKCRPVDERLQKLHWVDLFPLYEKGITRILRVLVPELDTSELSGTSIPQISSKPKTQSDRDSTAGKDYFERVEGNVYTGPVYIQQETPTSKAKKQVETVHKREAEPQQKVSKSRKEKEPSVIHLRSEPLTVSADEAEKVFRVKTDKETYPFTVWRPLEYIQNEYEDQGKVVVDHATGLIWQKSGSKRTLRYQRAQEYVQDLNQEKFAGYDDWRLPTIPELMSLLEPEKRSNNLYINPIFDVTQQWCWSADRRSSGAAWLVYFDRGSVGWLLPNRHCVRCVRSWRT